MQIEEEQRERDAVREQYSNSEKRCSLLQAEKEELMATLESVILSHSGDFVGS